VVIFFYPKDGSPGCTMENCLIRDRLREFEELDSVVMGISRDSVESHRKFASKHGLAHYLLSDVVGDVIRRYGALGLFGITKRVTYIIDRQGRVRKIIRSLDPRRHVDEALDFLRVNLNPSQPI
ncbi:MAG: peroxiredoxin, partial [Nitrososphaerota archaeon]